MTLEEEMRETDRMISLMWELKIPSKEAATSFQSQYNGKSEHTVYWGDKMEGGSIWDIVVMKVLDKIIAT